MGKKTRTKAGLPYLTETDSEWERFKVKAKVATLWLALDGPRLAPEIVGQQEGRSENLRERFVDVLLSKDFPQTSLRLLLHELSSRLVLLAKYEGGRFSESEINQLLTEFVDRHGDIPKGGLACGNTGLIAIPARSSADDTYATLAILAAWLDPLTREDESAILDRVEWSHEHINKDNIAKPEFLDQLAHVRAPKKFATTEEVEDLRRQAVELNERMSQALEPFVGEFKGLLSKATFGLSADLKLNQDTVADINYIASRLEFGFACPKEANPKDNPSPEEIPSVLRCFTSEGSPQGGISFEHPKRDAEGKNKHGGFVTWARLLLVRSRKALGRPKEP